VFAQTFDDREVIVVNDGAADSTARLLAPWVERRRIRYLEQPRRGPAAARNLSLSVARGEFVALLDDDDVWPRDKLAWQVAAMRSEPRAVLVYGSMETMGEPPHYRFPDGEAPHGRVCDAFLERNWIRSLGQTLIRHDSLRAAGGFDERLWGADDWDLYLRLSTLGEFLYDPRCALHYRVHPSNASKDFLRMYRNARRVHHRYLGRVPRPSTVRLWRLSRASMRSFCMNEFLAAVRPEIQARHWTEVCRLSARAVRIDPARVALKTPVTLAVAAADRLMPAIERARAWALGVSATRRRIMPDEEQLSSRGWPVFHAQPPLVPGRRVQEIQIQGPFDDATSLAIVNREMARALACRPGIEVTLVPTPGHAPDEAALVNDPEIERLWRRAAGEATPEWVIRNVYPPDTGGLDPARRNFLYFAWEESLIPDAWALRFNRHLDGVMVPSTHVASILRDSGVAISIGVVPYGVESGFACAGEVDPLPLGTTRRVRFLHISSGFARKGCDVLLKAFADEFSATDDVCLIVKTLPRYYTEVPQTIRRLRRWRPRCPEIIHLDAELDALAMQRLYRSASCLVHPARAEGFGLTVAEAMMVRIPVIVTGYGGVTDFCSAETAQLLGYSLVPSTSHHRVPGAKWAEPDVRQLRSKMRAVYERLGSAELSAMVERAHCHASSELTWERAADRALAFMRDAAGSPSGAFRGAMVTTWNARCGVAEYSRSLLAATPSDIASWRVLAPVNQALTAEDESTVSRCWSTGPNGDLTGIIAAAEAANLDFVHLQFAFGLFALDNLARLVTELVRRKIRVLVTAHAIRAGTERHSANLQSIAAALASADRIFVHTAGDRRQLAAWGLGHNTSHVPHGFASTKIDKTARHTRSVLGSPVVSSFGFLRPHKGILQLIEAVALLVRQFPDIALLAMTALYPGSESQAYLQRCLERASALGIAARCHIETEFLSSADMVTRLQIADVVVLPYSEIVDSASGAVRIALASQRPVIATATRTFADVAREVHQIRSSAPRVIARGIRRVLDDKPLAMELVARADDRAAKDSWVNMARIHAKAIRAIFAP